MKFMNTFDPSNRETASRLSDAIRTELEVEMSPLEVEELFSGATFWHCVSRSDSDADLVSELNTELSAQRRLTEDQSLSSLVVPEVRDTLVEPSIRSVCERLVEVGARELGVELTLLEACTIWDHYSDEELGGSWVLPEDHSELVDQFRAALSYFFKRSMGEA